jgi:hypothetical protein
MEVAFNTEHSHKDRVELESAPAIGEVRKLDVAGIISANNWRVAWIWNLTARQWLRPTDGGLTIKIDGVAFGPHPLASGRKGSGYGTASQVCKNDSCRDSLQYDLRYTISAITGGLKFSFIGIL